MSVHSPRQWAKLTIYSALRDYAGDPKKDKITSSRIMEALQRLSDDLHGELIQIENFRQQVIRTMNPEQGTDYEDMGEWADGIIEAFVPSKKR